MTRCKWCGAEYNAPYKRIVQYSQDDDDGQIIHRVFETCPCCLRTAKVKEENGIVDLQIRTGVKK